MGADLLMTYFTVHTEDWRILFLSSAKIMNSAPALQMNIHFKDYNQYYRVKCFPEQMKIRQD